MRASRRAHRNQPGPDRGDVDADWESAYSVGDEAPGGDNPTPDQDVVDDIGKAVGVQYEDNEELKGEAKIAKRDKHRWELDPASAEDYDDRQDRQTPNRGVGVDQGHHFARTDLIDGHPCRVDAHRVSRQRQRRHGACRVRSIPRVD